MSEGLAFEYLSPTWDEPCPRSGALMVQLKRLIYQDGKVVAVYYASYVNEQPDGEVLMLFSCGDWEEGSDPASRVSFFLRVRAVPNSYEVMLDDATGSPWAKDKNLGQLLSREEAFRHPWHTQVFEVLEYAMMDDQALSGFLRRAERGRTAEPLEFSFFAPDEIAMIEPGERDSRVRVGEFFMHLGPQEGAGAERHFVRCLFPVQVEGYSEWSPSFWVEVGTEDFERIEKAWSEQDAYLSLQFEGRAANDLVEPELQLPLGAKVKLAVTDPNQPPRVVETSHEGAHALLQKGWSKARFESYAILRGFL